MPLSSAEAKQETSAYAELSDEALLRLLFTGGDQLPMEFAREAISRGERMAAGLAEIALERANWERIDAGWCAPFHACFLLAAIPGGRATEALLGAFDLSAEFDNDWVYEDWPSILGSRGADILPPLRERALRKDLNYFWRYRALCGMASAALRHPECKPEVFAFIAKLAADPAERAELRIWAGDILLDMRLKEHEPLLHALAKLPENDVYHPDDVNEAFAKAPELYWYERDWLDFYSPKKLAQRRKRWEGERLSERKARHAAMTDLREEAEELPLLPREEAEKRLGELLPLARRVDEAIADNPSGLSREELARRCALAFELHETVVRDRSKTRLFESYLPDLLGWLTPLGMNAAGQGLTDEAARLTAAWSDIMEPEVFLGDRAVILAEAGRSAEAREQLEENLELFPDDDWVQIKAGDAYRALKDLPAAEKCYRRGYEAAEDAEDRSAAAERLVETLRESGKIREAADLEARERSWRENQEIAERFQTHLETIVRTEPKVGRNEPCSCGSGKKYKKCCLGRDEQAEG